MSWLMTQDEMKSFLKDGGKNSLHSQLPLIIVFLGGSQLAAVLCSSDILSERCEVYIIFDVLLYTPVSWSHNSRRRKFSKFLMWLNRGCDTDISCISQAALTQAGAGGKSGVGAADVKVNEQGERERARERDAE